jgi:hypothetical protein
MEGELGEGVAGALASHAGRMAWMGIGTNAQARSARSMLTHPTPRLAYIAFAKRGDAALNMNQIKLEIKSFSARTLAACILW